MRILRHPELRALTVATVAAVVAIVALSLLLVHRVGQTQAFREQTAANCRALEIVKDNIRQTLAVSRARALARDHVDAGQREAVERAYDQEIGRYAPIDCPNP